MTVFILTCNIYCTFNDVITMLVTLFCYLYSVRCYLCKSSISPIKLIAHRLKLILISTVAFPPCTCAKVLLM